MAICYCDGEFVALERAALPLQDLAILRGYGVFDYMQSYGGKPFRLDAHLQRLQRSAALIGLACPWDSAQLGEIVLETLRRNHFDAAGIRILLTGGDSADGFSPQGASRLLVMVNALQPPPAGAFARGVAVGTVELRRSLPEAKTVHYIPGIMALQSVGQRVPGAIEAIYTDGGFVREGTRSNTFIYRGGRWITPERDILPGITRAEVIKLLQREQAVDIRDITLAEYLQAEEIIITSSSKEVLPVVQVNDKRIGAGSPGRQTKRLMLRWRLMTAEFAAQPPPL